MEYKLSRKNAEKKWWVYGNMRENQWGNQQASFKVSALKELITLAENEGSEWVNLSVFEKKDTKDKDTTATFEAAGDSTEIDDSLPY